MESFSLLTNRGQGDGTRGDSAASVYTKRPTSSESQEMLSHRPIQWVPAASSVSQKEPLYSGKEKKTHPACFCKHWACYHFSGKTVPVSSPCCRYSGPGMKLSHSPNLEGMGRGEAGGKQLSAKLARKYSAKMIKVSSIWASIESQSSSP